MVQMFYIYRHIRLDTNEPFYIGKGSYISDNAPKSYKYKRAYNKSTRTKDWKNIVNKCDYDVEIIFEHEDEDVIFEKEKEFIKLYGRRVEKQGSLVNLTSGGSGFHDYCHNKDKDYIEAYGEYKAKKVKNKISKSLKEYYEENENPNLGKTPSNKTRAKISKKLKAAYKDGKKSSSGENNPMFGKKHSSETRKKISKANSGKNNANYGKACPDHIKEKLSSIFSKAVLQYNNNGKFIKEYKSLKKAADDNSVTTGSISSACKIKHTKSAGYFWRYKSDNTTNKNKLDIKNIKKVRQNNTSSKELVQISKEDKILNRYPSVTKASEDTGYDISLISKVCRGEKKQAYGFKWEYTGA